MKKLPPLHPYAADALILREIFSSYPFITSLKFYFEGHYHRYSLATDGVDLIEINESSVNIHYLLFNKDNLDPEAKSLLVELNATIEDLVSVQEFLKKLSPEFTYAYNEETITMKDLKPFLKGRA